MIRKILTRDEYHDYAIQLHKKECPNCYSELGMPEVWDQSQPPYIIVRCKDSSNCDWSIHHDLSENNDEICEINNEFMF